MDDPKSTKIKTCSCWQKSGCPLNQNCLPECLKYNAAVNISTTDHTWELKENDKNYTMDWLHYESISIYLWIKKM